MLSIYFYSGLIINKMSFEWQICTYMNFCFIGAFLYLGLCLSWFSKTNCMVATATYSQPSVILFLQFANYFRKCKVHRKGTLVSFCFFVVDDHVKGTGDRGYANFQLCILMTVCVSPLISTKNTLRCFYYITLKCSLKSEASITTKLKTTEWLNFAASGYRPLYTSCSCNNL